MNVPGKPIAGHVTLQPEDWRAGYDAGVSGVRPAPGSIRDELAWYSGYIEGAARRRPVMITRLI